MIKYELKKLFKNKFVSASFFLIFLLVLGSAIHSYILYRNNITGAPFVLLQKGVLPDTTVSIENIDSLLARYNEIKEDDGNYAQVNTEKRDNGIYLHGKYADKMREYSQKSSLTEEELAELDRLASFQIKDELYPEFCALHYMLSDFTNRHITIDPDYYSETEWSRFDYPDNEDKSTPVYTEGYNLRDEYMVNNGITFGRCFGWAEMLNIGADTIPLLLAAAAAIAAVILFTGEYTAKTDTLIMASKKGKTKIVHTKLLAGTLFSVILTLYYFAVMLICYGCLFSLDGANCTSQIFINGRSFTYGECFIIMLLCTLFCIASITVTALAVSAFCTKTLPAVLLAFLITLLPFLIGFAFYIPNDALRELLDTLPAQALLYDFGYSHYFMLGNRVTESHIYIIPAAALQALLFAPLIYIGWKRHKIAN